MVNGGVLEVGAGGSGYSLVSFRVFDPQGLRVVVFPLFGCISLALHATNRWDRTEFLGEVCGLFCEPLVSGFVPGGYLSELVQRVSLWHGPHLCRE